MGTESMGIQRMQMNRVPVSVDVPFPGVQRLRCGVVPQPTLLEFAGASPSGDGLRAMETAEMPADCSGIVVSRSSGYLVVSVPLAPDERLYGFGLQYHALEHRGRLFELRVDHYKGRDDGRTHAPIPFYVSSRGYGMLVNAAARIVVYAGRTHRKEHHPEIRSRRDPDWQAVAPSSVMELALREEGVELVLFAGPTPLDVVRRFNLYCGGGCLPPKWGLGFWHRTPLDYTATQAEAEADAFLERGYPLDVIGLEPGWHSSSYPTTFEWHAQAFPDPGSFVARLDSRGIRVNLWGNCFIHPECELGRVLEPLSASHTGSWGGYCPDLSLEEVRQAIISQHLTQHVGLGVSGYKLDECDDDNWLFPDYADFPSGTSGETLHQVYGTLLQRTTVDLFRRAGRRTYGLVRATNAGTVSFPYVIYNDCYDHREYITGLCSGSLCGVLFTPEARDARTSEEWLRRIQATCFSPLAQLNAWASGTRPWDFPEVEQEVQRVMILRTRLVPYLYTAFADYRRDGTPPFRAMQLCAQPCADGTTSRKTRGAPPAATDNPYSLIDRQDVSDQYMMGPNLLVAPFFAGEPSRTVVLPPGRWYDFFTGAFAGEQEVIELSSTRPEIPLFVRDGGIVPLFEREYLSVPPAGTDTPIEVRHYGRSPGEYELYDDDGETYAFEAGASGRRTLRADRDPATGRLRGSAGEPAGPFDSGYRTFTWRFMTGAEG